MEIGYMRVSKSDGSQREIAGTTRQCRKIFPDPA